MNENPWLGYRNRPKRIKKYNYWYSFFKRVYNYETWRLCVHTCNLQHTGSVDCNSLLDHRSRCEKIHNALDSGIYNEDNLYAIRREAIPWGLTSIYSYSQLKSRIYHIVKCQGCTVKQSPLPLFHCWTQTYMYLVCLINYPPPPHPFLSLWAVHLEKWEIKLCLYSQRTANDSCFFFYMY